MTQITIVLLRVKVRINNRLRSGNNNNSNKKWQQDQQVPLFKIPCCSLLVPSALRAVIIGYLPIILFVIETATLTADVQ